MVTANRSHRGRAFSDALDLLQGARHPATLYGHMLSAVSRVVGADISSLNTFDRTGQVKAYARTDPMHFVSPEVQSVFRQYVHEHPMRRAAVRSGRVDQAYRRPGRLSDFISDEKLQRLELYQWFYRPLRVKRQLITSVFDGDDIVVLALNRSKRDFSPHELQLISDLQPSLQQATDAARARFSAAVMSIAAEGRLRFHRLKGCQDKTGRAAEILHAFSRDSGHSTDDKVLKQIHAEIWPAETRHSANWDYERQVRLSSQHGWLDLTILSTHSGETAWVLLHGQVKGLTPTEASVLWRLMETPDTPNLVGVLGKPERTVETHINNVNRKLGVHQRRDAVRLVSNMMATGDFDSHR